MIRCEKCGHKLADGQKICNICKTPVNMMKEEEINFENELAESIAKIVENETTDAELYVKKIQNTLDRNSNYNTGSQTSQRTTTNNDTRSNVASSRGLARTEQNEKNVTNSRQTQSTKSAINGRMASDGRTSTNGRVTSDGRALSNARTSSNIRQTNTRTTNERVTTSKRLATNGEKPSNPRFDNNARTSQNRPVSSRRNEENRTKNNNTSKIFIIVASVLAALVLTIGLAYLTISRLFIKAQDNFIYNNNTGIELFQNSQYDKAIPFLEKAMTYPEAAGKVNLRFTLYDCYVRVGDKEKAVSMLYNILSIDQYNLEAIYNLQNYYEEANATNALVDLYQKYKDTPASAAVKKYYVSTPDISVASGEYNNDISVILSVSDNSVIYYTLDGSEPTLASQKYTAPIEIKQGNTVLKCMAANSFGITSEVAGAEYKVSYQAPKKPTVSPASGSYNTEQMIVIGNIPAGGKAYYTLDNTKPNKKSTLYEGPFEMPTGNFVLQVIVYDKNGLESSVTKRNYVLELQDKINEKEAENLVYSAMIYKNMINQEHKTADAEPLELVLDEKREIDGKQIWCFDLLVYTESGPLKANYQMGVDAETGYAYTIYENYGIYKLDPVVF